MDTSIVQQPSGPIQVKETYTVFDDEHPTVIVIHASAGSGHRSAARSVEVALRKLREEDPTVPDDLRIEFLDIFELGRIPWDGDKVVSGFIGPTRPIYDLSWRFTLTGRILWGGGTAWTRIMFPSFTEHVQQVKPLAVIATHMTACNVAVGSRMISGLDYRIIAVDTDYETEGMWPHMGTDLFCVATEAMAETLRARKVEEERIRITGIPTREGYAKDFDKREERAKWGFSEDESVVLCLAGARLQKPYERFRASLEETLPYLHRFNDMRMVVVTGTNEEYATHLRREKEQRGLENLTVLGYVDDMASLMAAADIVVSKSGGLVVTECLNARVPMVLLGKAYGQEKINVRMLTSAGAAMHVTTSRELLKMLRHLIDSPQSLEAMLVNANYLRKPHAARDIAKAALELSSKPFDKNQKRLRKHFLRFYLGHKPAHTR